MPISAETIEFVRRSRKAVEILADNYHEGGFWGSGLTGYCGIASRFLVNLAKKYDIKMQLVVGLFNGMTHCWVEYDGFCIDLTISQFKSFNTKKFSICKINDQFYNRYYTPDMRNNSAVRHQRTWQGGQEYSSHANLLWSIYRNL